MTDVPPVLAGEPAGAASAAFSAVVLAGGTARRLGGADKPSLLIAGRALLARALDAAAEAVEVVVVGDPLSTSRPVVFVRELPASGGPAAALLAGRDALTGGEPTVAVLACDMPFLTPATVRRLRLAADGHDGAVLLGPDGRRQLAVVLDVGALDRVRPEPGRQHGLPMHQLLAALELAEVSTIGSEHRDVDTWDDVRELSP